jgi:hypothetical protein
LRRESSDSKSEKVCNDTEWFKQIETQPVDKSVEFHLARDGTHACLGTGKRAVQTFGHNFLEPNPEIFVNDDERRKANADKTENTKCTYEYRTRQSI